MLGIVSSCAIVSLSLRQNRYSPIFDFKNAVTLKTGLGIRQGHWKCYRHAYTTSYWLSIVTMALSRVVSEIQCRKMSWPWNRGQRSLKVIGSSTTRYIMYGFLLVFFSNFVPKTHRFFLDIRLQKCSDIENRVSDPSRSLKISPFDRAHTTSYWRAIVTMALGIGYRRRGQKTRMIGLPDGQKKVLR